MTSKTTKKSDSQGKTILSVSFLATILLTSTIVLMIPAAEAAKFQTKERPDVQMFFCGWNKNVKTLADCLKYENYGSEGTYGNGWYGKINVMVYAPGWNTDSGKIDYIGTSQDDDIGIISRGELGVNQANLCGMQETDIDTGLFVGRLKLKGFDHDIDGDGTTNTKFANGPDCYEHSIWTTKKGPNTEMGYVPTGQHGSVTVYWKYNDDPEQVVMATADYSWNIAEIEFNQQYYTMDDVVTVKMWDKDYYKLDRKELATVNVKVWSDSDLAGVELELADNLAPQRVFLTETGESSGQVLRAAPGDKIYAEFTDYTLPLPYDVNDDLDVMAVAHILKD